MIADPNNSEMDGPQFKLDIRNQPIQEEDSDAAKALSDTANILRAVRCYRSPSLSHTDLFAQQAQPPQRKLGTTRGRRDVRNTIFVPNPSSENLPVGDPGIGLPPISPYAKATVDDHRGADAQSVRSAHSLSSLSAGTAVKHPEMAGPGLNASIVETVAAWFENGAITKSIVIGELALVNHASSLTETSTSIRLENFPVLEKVAPNPTFIDSVPSKSGEYKLDLSQISKPQVAFKYQVHLDDTIASQGAHVPISLSANWKAEPTQISVILNYGFNPLFLSSTSPRQVNLSNVVVIVTVEGAKSITCQSKPMGTYSKERNLIYWRLGDLNLREEDGGLKLLARFSTESEAKPGNIEARWEVIGDNAAGLGSGLGIARVAEKSEGMGTADPFADNGTEKKEEWADVKVVRKLVSGKYVAH